MTKEKMPKWAKYTFSFIMMFEFCVLGFSTLYALLSMIAGNGVL